jgi:hypothetical protein
MVGQVDDLALPRPFDCGVRLVDKTLQAFGQPVIAAGLLELATSSRGVCRECFPRPPQT